MRALDGWERGLWAAGAALWLACVNAVPFGHYVDDVVWVLLSRRMLHGSLAADWSYFPRLETTLPWGFSLLLLPVTAAAGAHALALKLACGAMTFGGLAFLYAALRARLDPAARRAWLVLLLFNGFLLSFDGAVMSEAGYLLLFGFSVWLALGRGWLREATPKRAAGLGVAAGLLALTRLLGGLWAAALFAELWRRRARREAALFALAAGVVLAPYALASRFSNGTYTYTGGYWALTAAHGLPAAARNIASNAYFYLKGLALLTCVYFPAFWPNVGVLKVFAVASALGAACWGAWRELGAEGGPALAAYMAAYTAACAVWPFQAPRFMEPLAPLFAFWLIAGIADAVPRRARATALAVLAGVAAMSNAGQVAALARESWTQPIEVSHRAQSWLAEHAQPGDFVVSMDVARLRYFAGLRGVHFLASDSAESFADQAARMGARWFFVEDAGYVGFAGGAPSVVALQHERLASYLARPDLFTLVHEDAGEGARVYQLRRR